MDAQQLTATTAQIILRARHSHLLNKYKADATTLNPSLITDVKAAWTAFVAKNLAKSLASPVPPGTVDAPASNGDAAHVASVTTYEQAQNAWIEISQRAQNDAAWFEAQKTAAEKFTMYLAAARAGQAGLETAEQALKDGKTGQDEAVALIESNKDAVSVWLDSKVCTD